MAAPLIRKTRVLAAKAETTVGTEISVAAADATFNAFNVVIQPEIEFIDRGADAATGASFSPLPGALAAYAGVCTFDHEVYGVAASAWAATFLPACGLKNTAGVYTPDSLAPEAAGSGTKTLTIAVYENGIKKFLTGAMGNVIFEFLAGSRMMAHFTFRGIWNTVADATILAPTYATTAPLRFASSALTVGSFQPKVQRFTVNPNNTLYLRETSETGKPSGLHSCIITNRRYQGQIDPEAHLVADHDPFGDWLARTERALSMSIGTAGNRVAIAAPKLQPVNVQEADRTGLQTHPLDFQLNKSAAAGNDEFTLTLD